MCFSELREPSTKRGCIRPAIDRSQAVHMNLADFGQLPALAESLEFYVCEALENQIAVFEGRAQLRQRVVNSPTLIRDLAFGIESLPLREAISPVPGQASLRARQQLLLHHPNSRSR